MPYYNLYAFGRQAASAIRVLIKVHAILIQLNFKLKWKCPNGQREKERRKATIANGLSYHLHNSTHTHTHTHVNRFLQQKPNNNCVVVIIISIILLRFGYNGYHRCSAIQSKMPYRRKYQRIR